MSLATILNLSSSSVGVGRLIALSVLVCGACVWDLRFRQIPNLLTAPIAVAGLMLAVVDKGWSGGGWAMTGLVIGAGLFLFPVMMNFVGAGDLKLMAAGGALLGPFGIFQSVLVGSIFGGVWAMAWIALKGRGMSTLPYAPPLALGLVSVFSFGA